MAKEETEFQIPVYATELIEQLDAMYPTRTPSIKDTERQIFHYAGLRDLIDFLKEQVRQEQHDGLDPTEDVLK